MSASHTLIVKKSVSVLNSSVNINFKEAFSSFGKMLIAGFSGQISTASEYGVDSLKELGLSDDPEHVAWLLITSSFLKSFENLMEEFGDLLTKELEDGEIVDLAQRIEHQLNVMEVSIDNNFFERPQDLSLFNDFEPALTLWLSSFGMDKYQAASFQYRLKGMFVLVLNEQWRADSEGYQCIAQNLSTPFAAATLDQVAWANYSFWLQDQVNTRVFGEAFGLKQVYIPLRGFYEEDNHDQESDKLVKQACDLHTHIGGWVCCFEKKNALKVISGGPGSGKSSFAKMLAAELAEKQELPVLFVPLHHFNMKDDLVEAVGDFVRDDRYLKNNPLLQETRQERLLLIFDGLDELSMQGQAATDAANQFIDKLIRLLDRQNDNGNKWQAIVTGRDLSVQSNEHNLCKKQQILGMLPYRLSDEEREDYQGESELLDVDQCDQWWKKFGDVKGLEYESIPSVLDTESLNPITREPLLNYLLSLSYERQEIEFNDSTSLNSIYYDLLKAVYERNYASNKHEASRYLEFDEFLEVLEEIALAVWHGNGRTASESYLFQRCEDGGLKPLLDKFSEGAKKGVVRLLTAFYFRQFDKDSTGDRTFEFTHKSFGEYLTARRIIGAVDSISQEVERSQKNSRIGWSHAVALEEWVKVTGPSNIDSYLLSFIKDEVTLKGKETSQKWQKVFAELLGTVVRDGSPMEKLVLLSFSEMLRQSANAEGALLKVHYACSIETCEVIGVDWGGNFKSWFTRVQIGTENEMIVGCLENLSLPNSNFGASDLFFGNLANSQLRNSVFLYAALCFCSFKNANLNGAIFGHSNLQHSNLEGANLEGADFSEANLKGANFNGANLKGVRFKEAQLQHASFEGANLNGADFEDANLRGANLKDVDFEGATFTRANIEGTILEDKEL